MNVKNQGFTLIEMLVVVVIIAILIGVAIRISNVSQDANAKAVTIKRLEQLRMAIEEYRAEYGRDPPVDRTKTLRKTDVPTGDVILTGNNDADYTDSVAFLIPFKNDLEKMTKPDMNGETPPDRPVYGMGLLAYLMPRERCEGRFDMNDLSGGGSGANKWIFDHNFWEPPKDPAREERFWQRIKPFVDDIIFPKPGDINSNPFFYNVPQSPLPQPKTWKPVYDLKMFTVMDGWGPGDTFGWWGHMRKEDNHIKYRSDPPHTTYRLWCDRGGPGKDIEGNVGF